jgi:hypothetical protein
MKKLEQPDGGLLMLYEDGPIPFENARGEPIHISVSDAHEMLIMFASIAFAVSEAPIDENGYKLHFNRAQKERLDQQIRTLKASIREKAEWVTRHEATAILSQNAGRPIDYNHIGILAKRGKVATKNIDGRTKLYRYSDIESYVVKHHQQRKQKELQPT